MTLSIIDAIKKLKPDYDKEKADLMSNELMIAYAGYYRKYHTIKEHISPGLNLLKEIKDLCENYPLVQFAWWYHDFYMVPGTPHNENVSADRAAFDGLNLDFNSGLIIKIFSLIFATKHEKKNIVVHDDEIIHDLDLYLLGDSPKQYERRQTLIRAEYDLFPIETYNKQRIFILDKFLQYKNMFCTEYFQGRFEQQARKNIKAEINILKSELEQC